MATKITNNFTLEELYASATAKAKRIDNIPPLQAVINLTYLAEHILQPLRDAMKEPVKIGSGYRCPKLNVAVGGADNSQHMMGQAADLCIDGDIKKGRRWFEWIRKNCVFDQLLFEHNAKGSWWIHVSYNPFGTNRKQANDNYKA